MFINKVSPSKLKTYLECKAKYKFKYVEYLRDIYNPNSNTNALQFGSYVHKILELGVNATTLLELQDLAMPDDVKANGIIDRVVKGKTGKYLVIDYKTSRRPATKESLFKDPQMLMYAYAIAKMYNAPLEDVTVAHYYPHLDKIISICYGTTQVSLFLRELKERVWEIRKKKKEDLNPSLNQFCDWCQYKTLCPEFGGTPKMLEEAKAAEKIKKAERKKSKNP